MKKVLLTFILGVTMLAYSQAQQRSGGMRQNPEERAKRAAENLEKELKLNAAQKDSVYVYSLAQAKEQQTLFQQGRDGDRQAAMAKMRSIQENTDGKIKAILNESQKKQYDEFLKERAERMRNFGGRGGRRGGNQ